MAAASLRAWLDQPGHHLLTPADAAYPQRLREIPNPPQQLFVDGDPEVLSTVQLAIVGSRNPTPAGRQRARDFAAYLAGRGLVITSGLALGIDGAAHAGALDADGLTVAVAATGLDTVYPHRHRTLAERIREQGCIVSEFAPGTEPRRSHFPSRNRIISGLSLGTLVVEAARSSGSLITARLAGEQGREVFAIPGSIDNPLSRGCHALIRNGAKLVEEAADILVELAPMMDNGRSEPERNASADGREEPMDEEHARLLAHLDEAPCTLDILARRSGMAVEAVSSMLLILELQGWVAIAPGGGYQKVR